MNANHLRLVILMLLALLACVMVLAPLPAHGDASPSDVHEVPRFVRERTEIVRSNETTRADRLGTPPCGTPPD